MVDPLGLLVTQQWIRLSIPLQNMPSRGYKRRLVPLELPERMNVSICRVRRGKKIWSHNNNNNNNNNEEASEGGGIQYFTMRKGSDMHALL
jgi:hypothetical protein